MLVFKKLNKDTFIGIPLTSKKKQGSHFFSFSYKQNQVSTGLIAQMRMFDSNRIEYRSGKIDTKTFEKLKKQIGNLFGITPQNKEEELHSSKGSAK